MIDECDVGAGASILIEKHREDAWFHASLRADRYSEAGDFDGYTLFKAILARIEELERMKPPGSTH